MAEGNITVEVSTQAAQAEIERLRRDAALLAREAHTWWTACRDATGEIERLREVAARMVAGIDHLEKLAREWEPDHSSGADRRGWLLAKDARDDAARLLGPNAELSRAPEQPEPERDACRSASARTQG